MAMPIAGVHNGVQPGTHVHRSSARAGVCPCGAVYDNGNVIVPVEFAGLCGRCAFSRGLRLGYSQQLASSATAPPPHR
jgi:hypothetical protein